jgi:hypothetical protein
MKTPTVASVIVVIFLFVGCAEQVNIEDYIPNTPSDRLVVEGLITSEYARHTVKLSRSGKVAADHYDPATGANVTISDGITTYILSEHDPGIYLTDSLKGILGNRYTLNVNFEGQVYEASDTMVPVSEFGRADEITLAPRPKDPTKGYTVNQLIVFGKPAVGNIKIENPTPADEFTELTYYVFPGIDPDNIFLNFTDASLTYTEGTQFTQTKFSLSTPHYQFLRALLLETEYNGGVFGSVRSNVPTNVSNGGLGFFGASEAIHRTGVIGSDGKLHW